eukprot:scaffold2281_cov43-Cyclotella_meneghiniana.AAC.6
MIGDVVQVPRGQAITHLEDRQQIQADINPPEFGCMRHQKKDAVCGSVQCQMKSLLNLESP